MAKYYHHKTVITLKTSFIFPHIANPETVNSNAGLIEPYFLGVYLNEPISIHCKSKSKVRWSKVKGTLPNAAAIEDNDICIDDVQLNDSGSYKCIGTTDNGLVFSIVTEVLVGSK